MIAIVAALAAVSAAPAAAASAPPATAAAASTASDVQPSGQAQETADLLSELIRIDTRNAPGDTRQVAARLATIFDKLGIPNETLLAPNGKAAHFIARLKGDGSARPILLAAHSDVVPVEPSRWSVDPLGGIQKDGYVWGRGALDNKGQLAAFVTAIRRLAKERVPLKRDIILLAEADEEQGTFHTGWLEKTAWDKIDAEYSLNEGGRTLQDQAGSVKQITVSLHDKLTISFRITASGTNGHSSIPLPPAETANGRLVRALNNLMDFRQPVALTPHSRRFLEGVARVEGSLAEPIHTVLRAKPGPDLEKAADRLIAADPERRFNFGGTLRNTLMVTMINSGVKPNVVPATADAVFNCRIFPGSSVAAFVEDIRKTIADPGIKLEIISRQEPFEQALAYYEGRSRLAVSPMNTPLFRAIENAAAKTWPTGVVLPMINPAAGDSAPWREHGVPVYGMSVLAIHDNQLSGIHGDDERVSIASLGMGAEFTYRVLKEVAGRDSGR